MPSIGFSSDAPFAYCNESAHFREAATDASGNIAKKHPTKQNPVNKPNDPVDLKDLSDLDPPRPIKERLLREFSERTLEHLDTLSDQPAWSNEDGSEAAGWLDGPVPEQGRPLDEILDLLFDRVIPCSLNTAGPGYLAYVPGGGLYSAALAEFVAAVVNRYAGVWVAAPGAVELETRALRWLVELMGLPESALGVFTTGGSMSNLLAVVAAREKLLGSEISDGVAYFSSEVHHSVIKAARIAGIAEDRIRLLPIDEDFRLQIPALEEAIAEDRRAGRRPFFVSGSAGTVNTGAVDSLRRIADVAEREGLWNHVDGAYGATFRLLPELHATLDGMERCDSLALDPHKGLFFPYGLGTLLVRQPADLTRAFHVSGSYLPQLQEGVTRFDFCEMSPELSRDWRGLRVWLPFMLHGVDAFRRALREKRELAVRAFETLSREEDVEIAAPPELSLFAFRQVFGDADLEETNRRNRKLLEEINRPARIYLTGTTLGGVFYLRICVLHLRTNRERVDEGLEIIRRALEERRV